MDLAPFFPLLKIAAAFVAMLACIRLRLPLWLSILAGSLALVLAFGLGLRPALGTALKAVIDPPALFLVVIVDLILIFSDLIEFTGLSRRLLDSLSGALTSPRLRLVFFPALLGLLPMPGGAVFSAPMVKTAAGDMPITGVDKSLINYWFRHIWELCWPLFPGLILASGLARLPLGQFAAAQIPGSLACMALGWWFLLRPLDLSGARPQGGAQAGWRRRALSAGLPLIIGIFGSLGLQTWLTLRVPSVHSEWGVVAGMTAAIALITVQYRVPMARLAAAGTSRHIRSMLLVIAAIYIFKDMLAATGAVTALSTLATGKAALIVAAVFLPWLVGFVGGINVAFVGAAFPILLAMMDSLQVVEHRLAYLVLAYFSGFAGVMVSPMHICFLLTCQYFEVELAGAWRRLVLPCLGLMLAAGAYFLLLAS